MKTSTAIAVVIALVVVLGAGYWYWSSNQMPAAIEPADTGGLGDASGSPAQGTVPQGGAQPGQNGTGNDGSVGMNLILGVSGGNTDDANWLSAYNGMTVYTYEPDRQTPGRSMCSGQCIVNWPAYVVPKIEDIHVSAATPGTVGTIKREDGTLQVTYNGMPLYFYVGDQQPRDKNGDGLQGVWHVVHP
jgi:predicted lipoprotein with Yx(FWY)xxD motif